MRADLLASFRVSLSRAPLAPHILEQLKRRGSDVLSGWYDFWHTSWERNVLTEVAIDRVSLGKNVVLTGKIDKVEILSSGSINVVDYKTKEPMSSNAIKGVTQTSTGNEYRQLLFYKILLDHYAPGKGNTWNMQSGQIDFLEPNKSGKYKKEWFPITSDMTKDLQETIKDVVNRIRNLSFWNDRCDDSRCRFCQLREMMGS